MKNLACLLSLVLVVACSSKKGVNVSTEPPPEMEKNLNVATGNRGEKIGIKDDTVKIQKQVYLEEELSRLQSEIGDLDGKIYGASRSNQGGLYLEIKNCRKRLSDPRVGGNGVPEPMPKWVKISEKDEDYNYHVDKRNNVVAVSEETLASRIDNLNKLKRVLTDKFDEMKDHLETCQDTYNTALINHGMDPKDTKAQGEWVDGPNGYKVWKMKKSSTNNPEELMKRKQQSESGE